MITTIFSHINDLNELKAIANEMVKSIQEAYQTRAKEIAGQAKEVATPANNPFPTPPPAPAKAKKEVHTAKKKAAPTTEPAQAKTAVVAQKADKENSEVAQISLADKDALKKLNLSFHKYSDKTWVLYGDTKCISKGLKHELNGWGRIYTDYKGHITGTKGKKFFGWLWRTADAQNVADTLGVKVKIA